MSTAGFTVVTSGGTRVPVTTSGDTVVVVRHASLRQLQAGPTTVAIGHVGPDEPGPPGQLEQAAADGKTVRGAVRPDGSRVHLQSWRLGLRMIGIDETTRQSWAKIPDQRADSRRQLLRTGHSMVSVS